MQFKNFETEYKPISLIFPDGEILTTDSEYSESLMNWDFADILYEENSRKLRNKNTLFLKRALFERGYDDEIERYNLRIQNSWIITGYKGLVGSSIGLILDRKNTIQIDGDLSKNLEIIIDKLKNSLNKLIVNSLFNALQYGTSVLILDFVGVGFDTMPVITSISPKKIIDIKYKETLIEKTIIEVTIKVTNELFIRFSRKESDGGLNYIEKSEYKTTNKNSNKLELISSKILVDQRNNPLQTIPIFMTNVSDDFKPLCRNTPFYWGYIEQSDWLCNMLSQHGGLISKFAAKYPFLTYEADIDNPPAPGEPDTKTKIQQQIFGRSGHDSVAIVNKGDKVSALSPDMKILEIDWKRIEKIYQERERTGISHLLYDNGNATATGVRTADQNQKSQVEIITDNQSSLWEQVFKGIADFYGEDETPTVRIGRDFSTENKLTNFQLINEFFDRGLITLQEAREIMKISNVFGDATDTFEPVDLQFDGELGVE